ncbi:Phosphoglycolate phosphatase [Marinibacterium anthonyi]|nr:Phosphoglycolate phosphatase [Marinibacterium anthonyi]
MADLKLVIFDVDGTLVDSQAAIVGAMTHAFAAVDAPLPARDVLLSIVGLSLDHAMPRLAPDLEPAAHDRMVEAYRDTFRANRLSQGEASMPLYPGALEALQALAEIPEVLLGVATGKSRRGLDAMIEAHGLEKYFVTRQVADDHPSKPHPSMILTAMSETGVDAVDTVMIGDTEFDMAMAAAAGVAGLGVSWGYHPVHMLQPSRAILDDFGALAGQLEAFWKEPA